MHNTSTYGSIKQLLYCVWEHIHCKWQSLSRRGVDCSWEIVSCNTPFDWIKENTLYTFDVVFGLFDEIGTQQTICILIVIDIPTTPTVRQLLPTTTTRRCVLFALTLYSSESLIIRYTTQYGHGQSIQPNIKETTTNNNNTTHRTPFALRIHRIVSWCNFNKWR